MKKNTQAYRVICYWQVAGVQMKLHMFPLNSAAPQDALPPFVAGKRKQTIRV